MNGILFSYKKERKPPIYNTRMDLEHIMLSQTETNTYLYDITYVESNKLHL